MIDSAQSFRAFFVCCFLYLCLLSKFSVSMTSIQNFFNELKHGDTSDTQLKCYEHFSSADGLKFEDFNRLINELFVDERGKSYKVSDDQMQSLFSRFDINADGIIDEKEFQDLWIRLVMPVLRPNAALLVIDVQNDFIDGTLALRNCPAKQEALGVVDVINNLLQYFSNVFYSFDWHPEDHISFVDNKNLYEFHEDSKIKVKDAKVYDTVLFSGPPKFEQTLWPRHCVQGEWGSELHSRLKVAVEAVSIYKGTRSNIDSYSAFWDNLKRSLTNLNEELKARGITDVFVCGLAYDYCVGSTALHALELGYRTVLVEDACRGVNDADILRMREKLLDRHACVVNSSAIPAMINGSDRNIELGIFLASSL